MKVYIPILWATYYFSILFFCYNKTKKKVTSTKLLSQSTRAPSTSVQSTVGGGIWTHKLKIMYFPRESIWRPEVLKYFNLLLSRVQKSIRIKYTASKLFLMPCWSSGLSICTPLEYERAYECFEQMVEGFCLNTSVLPQHVIFMEVTPKSLYPGIQCCGFLGIPSLWSLGKGKGRDQQVVVPLNHSGQQLSNRPRTTKGHS